MSSSIESYDKEQYHHFIPRFILKNFSHRYKPQGGSRKRGKQKKKDFIHLGELVVNAINLTVVEASISEVPPGKMLGLTDMYRDLRKVANSHHLEEKLSKLEGRAAIIITKIRKAFEDGQHDVRMPRSEKDVLRKFLFIMKYRGPTQHRRYSHHRADDYCADDKTTMLEYMQKKGFKRPIEVWLDNIDAMIEVNLNLPHKLAVKWLNDHAYPEDVGWFMLHMRVMYLAFCTPMEDDEFILSANAYSIHEGTVSSVTHVETGQEDTVAYTEFHLFAPISPKIILVLRSFLLPLPEEDVDQRIAQFRQQMVALTTAQHHDPQRSRSMLEDLPVTKAKCSYVNAGRVPGSRPQAVEAVFSAGDIFNFRFFPISPKHCETINFIMLENAQNVSTIVFDSRQRMVETLRRFLTMPCDSDGGASWKTFDDSRANPRLIFLQKLTRLMSKDGEPVVPVYKACSATLSSNIDLSSLEGEVLIQMLLDSQDSPATFMGLYSLLGTVSSYRQKP